MMDHLDNSIGIYKIIHKFSRKIFPDHWSFLLGEIALYSFIILLITGIWLIFFFNPSSSEVIYHGSYTPIKGIAISEAYKSILDITFDIRGGLLIRQIHHWASIIFTMSVFIHMFRIFFTGAFRVPREINWSIGFGLFVLGILEGFTGYSLPDDLLSGIGLRIASGVLLSIPFVGSYLSYMLFGGEFPGNTILNHLYIIHILILPLVIIGLISVHLLFVLYHKHTQYPGKNKSNKNVYGYSLFPVYALKAGGYFFIVASIIFLMASAIQINPVWLYGPYTPTAVSAGSQPDWYMGFLEGALRIFPNISIKIGHYIFALSTFIPSVIFPGILFTSLFIYPFIENYALQYSREYHLLDKIYNMPIRTAFGSAWLSIYLILIIAGSNDIIGYELGLSINLITEVIRVLIFILPIATYIITYNICINRQRIDNHIIASGVPTGVVLINKYGGYSEMHKKISEDIYRKIISRNFFKPYNGKSRMLLLINKRYRKSILKFNNKTINYDK